MVIPDKLQIAGETWRIYSERTAPKDLLEDEELPLYRNGTYGLTFFDARAIVLADGLPPHTLQETFCHELLHVLIRVSCSQDLGPALEERLVEALDEHLSGALSQILKSNAKGKR